MYRRPGERFAYVRERNQFDSVMMLDGFSYYRSNGTGLIFINTIEGLHLKIPMFLGYM